VSADQIEQLPLPFGRRKATETSGERTAGSTAASPARGGADEATQDRGQRVAGGVLAQGSGVELDGDEVRPVGGTKPVKVRARVIAATNVDVDKQIAAGRFRQDLYYRLSVIVIAMPALRERRLDIPLLINHFIDRSASRSGRRITLSSETLDALMRYRWPGNVRELENTIERAMVLSEADLLLAADLPERIREARDPVQVQLASGELSIKKTTRVIEETLIRRALQKTKGNRTRAAEVLELSHRALLYKIKDYKITDL